MECHQKSQHVQLGKEYGGKKEKRTSMRWRKLINKTKQSE